MSRDILGDLDDESKMLVITLGSNEKRKRLDFAKRVISSLPEEVSKDINVIHMGSDVKLTDDQLLKIAKCRGTPIPQRGRRIWLPTC